MQLAAIFGLIMKTSFLFFQNRNQSAATKSFQMAMHDSINNMEIDFAEMLREMTHAQGNRRFPYDFVEVDKPSKQSRYQKVSGGEVERM